MSAVIPDGSVIITPTEMYREQQATHQAVRDVSGKLDSALSDHARRMDGTDKDIADHETRIRGLEKWRWGAGGVVAVVSVGASGLIGYVMSAR